MARLGVRLWLPESMTPPVLSERVHQFGEVFGNDSVPGSRLLIRAAIQRVPRRPIDA